MYGIHLTLLDLLDREVRVVSRRYCSAGFLYGSDGFGAGAGDDDVDWCGEFFFASGEEFDAVAGHAMDAPAGAQFFEGDGLGGVEAAGVEPVLNLIEVDWRELGGESITGPY